MTEPTKLRSRFRLTSTARLAACAAGLLALGAATGAVVTAQTRPSVSMAPAAPVAIHSLSSTGIVTIQGRVAEIFGNKFVMQDATGRALVDTGRDGDERQLVTTNEAVTIQGRFDRGFVHAAFLIGPDRKVLVLGPLAGPPHAGSDRGPGAPPPLPGADGKAPSSPPPAAAPATA